MKKSLILFAAVLLILPAFAVGSADSEVANKAKFIIDLIDHVKWSDDAKPDDTEKIVIYVVGECPVRGKLEELAEQASDKGKKIEVDVVSPGDDLGASHILFLPTDDLSMLAKVLKKLRGSRTVTVADAKDFARYGVMISFFLDENDSEIHYEVNRLVLESAGIGLSSKLLDKADLI